MKKKPDPMQRVLTPRASDVLEVSRWVRAFVDGLDEDKVKAWAICICEAQADPMHGRPETNAYTAREAQDALKIYGSKCDFPKRKDLFVELKEQRRRNKRHKRLEREARQPKAQITSTRALCRPTVEGDRRG